MSLSAGAIAQSQADEAKQTALLKSNQNNTGGLTPYTQSLNAKTIAQTALIQASNEGSNTTDSDVTGDVIITGNTTTLTNSPNVQSVIAENIPTASFTASGIVKQTVFNVKDYGAKGDGITDDTAAITNAIAALVQAGGGTLLIPGGTYLTSGFILSSQTVNMAVMGYGATLLASGDSQDIIQINKGDNTATIQIFGLTINGNHYSDTNGIHIIDATGVSLNGLNITGCAGSGIWFDNVNGYNEVHSIYGCFISLCGTGINFIKETSGSNSFDELSFISTGVNDCTTGVYVGAGTSMFRTHFYDVTIWTYAGQSNVNLNRGMYIHGDIGGANWSIGFEGFSDVYNQMLSLGGEYTSVLDYSLTLTFTGVTNETEISYDYSGSPVLVWNQGNSIRGISNTQQSSSRLQNSQMSLAVDETYNNLLIQVKYSNSTVNKAAIPLNASGTQGPITITSASSSALVVGANGATNPVFLINADTASVATGLQIIGAAVAGGLAVSVISSGTNENLTIDAKGSGTVGINTANTSAGLVTIGNSTSQGGMVNYGSIRFYGGSTTPSKTIRVNNGAFNLLNDAQTSILLTITDTGSTSISSPGSNAFAVGVFGTSNPAFNIDTSTGSSVTGLNIKSAATGNGVAIKALDSGSNTALTIDAKGTGTIGINTLSTTSGLVTLGNSTSNAGVLVNGALTINSAIMIATNTSFTNGAASSLGTLTNAPAATNPTKWIPINDNGTTRYIPAW